jgi:hypothetical protein
LARSVEKATSPVDEALPVSDVVLSQGRDLLENELLRLQPQVAAEFDRGVVALDGGFDTLDAQCPLSAGKHS